MTTKTIGRTYTLPGEIRVYPPVEFLAYPTQRAITYHYTHGRRVTIPLAQGDSEIDLEPYHLDNTQTYGDRVTRAGSERERIPPVYPGTKPVFEIVSYNPDMGIVETLTPEEIYSSLITGTWPKSMGCKGLYPRKRARVRYGRFITTRQSLTQFMELLNLLNYHNILKPFAVISEIPHYLPGDLFILRDIWNGEYILWAKRRVPMSKLWRRKTYIKQIAERARYIDELRQGMHPYRSTRKK